MIILLSSVNLIFTAHAALLVSPDSIQLQQLINQSEKQIQSLNKILKSSKNDAASLERGIAILEKLSAGLEKSIESYQGTKIYERALIELQSKNDFSKTYSDSQRVRDQALKSNLAFTGKGATEKEFLDFMHFQKETVKANRSDLDTQDQLQKALVAAPPGFIPKIEAQAQLGGWQANTRLSSQMTELLSAVHAMREELRALRLKQEGSAGVFDALITGAEMQNQKQNERNSFGKR